MIRADAELNAGAFIGGLKQIDSQLVKLEGGFKMLGASFMGFTALIGMFAKLKEALDFGGKLEDLKTQTGASAHDLVILGQAFDLAGVGSDKLGGFLFKMQTSLSGVNEVGGKTAAALHKLGLTQKDMSGSTALEQIEKLKKGFMGISDYSTRAAIAVALFGKKGGQDATKFFGNPDALEDSQKSMGPLANLMEKNASQFDALGDSIQMLKGESMGFAVAILEGLVPAGKDMADALGQFDFIGAGRAVGMFAGTFIQLGTALTGLLGPINAVIKGLEEIMENSEGKAILAGATAGTLVGGPVGTLMGAFAGMIGGAFLPDGKKGDAKSGFAEAFRNPLAIGGGAHDSPVSALQRVGLGGNFASGGDGMLSNAQRQTTILQSIREASQRTVELLGQKQPGGGMTRLPI